MTGLSGTAVPVVGPPGCGDDGDPGAGPAVAVLERGKAAGRPASPVLVAAGSFATFLFRGYTPLVMWNHPIVGVALSIALFLLNPLSGAMALLGSAAATAAGLYALRVDPRCVNYGLFGLNGLFAGLAVAPYAVLAPAFAGLAAVAGGLSALPTAFFFRRLTLRRQLPMLVLPFILTTWLVDGLVRLFPAVSPGDPLDCAPWWDGIEAVLLGWLPAVLADFFVSLSRLLYLDSVIVGLVVFAMWLPRNYLPAIIALASSATASGLLSVLGTAPEAGPRSFVLLNAVLAAFLLGGVLLRPTVPGLVYAWLGGLLAAVVTLLALPLFAWLQLPVLVGPCVAVTLLLLVALGPGRYEKGRAGIFRVPLGKVGRPEGALFLRWRRRSSR